MTLAEILDKAADVITQRGWWQGGFVPKGTSDLGSCPVCPLAAINVAAGGDPRRCIDAWPDTLAFAAASALATYLGCPEDEPLATCVGEHWNDDPARTKEQVLAALRGCAADLRQEGR